MSGVFQNIDPPPPSPPSECVLPPHQRRGGTHSPGGEGVGVNILEDARHWIGLLQYNLTEPHGITDIAELVKCDEPVIKHQSRLMTRQWCCNQSQSTKPTGLFTQQSPLSTPLKNNWSLSLRRKQRLCQTVFFFSDFFTCHFL